MRWITIATLITYASSTYVTFSRKALVDEFRWTGDCTQFNAVKTEDKYKNSICECQIPNPIDLDKPLKGSFYMSLFKRYMCYYGDAGVVAGASWTIERHVEYLPYISINSTATNYITKLNIYEYVTNYRLDDIAIAKIYRFTYEIARPMEEIPLIFRIEKTSTNTGYKFNLKWAVQLETQKKYSGDLLKLYLKYTAASVTTNETMLLKITGVKTYQFTFVKTATTSRPPTVLPPTGLRSFTTKRTTTGAVANSNNTGEDIYKYTTFGLAGLSAFLLVLFFIFCCCCIKLRRNSKFDKYINNEPRTSITAPHINKDSWLDMKTRDVPDIPSRAYEALDMSQLKHPVSQQPPAYQPNGAEGLYEVTENEGRNLDYGSTYVSMP